MSPERKAKWHQPSLVRRMVVAVVLAFALVAMVLITKDYTDFRHLRDEQAALRNAAAQMADLLATSTDATTATHLVQTLERQTNRSRQDSLGAPPLLFELRRQDGSLIYASEGTPPLGEAADKPVLQLIEGRPYHVARADKGFMADPPGRA
jgi:two-component system sensor histidine kinase QseC